MKQIVHYGIYDEFTEIELADYTAHSSTAYEIIKNDLLGDLNALIESSDNNSQFEWAVAEKQRYTEIKDSIENSTSLQDFIDNDRIHYVILDLSGEFDE